MEFLFTILYRGILAALPLIIASQGQVLMERSGILNLGVEGIMAMGAWGAFVGTLGGGPFIGMAMAMVMGASFGLIHAGMSVGLRANQTVSGLAIAMFGTGLAKLLGKPYIGKAIAQTVEPWVFMMLAVFITFAVWAFLHHTKGGLRVRLCGEHPVAAESSGTNVAGVRTLTTIAGGAIIGLSGAFIAQSYQTSWNDEMTGGKGWLVVALVIFSLWKPWRSMIASFLFAMVFVLQYVLQPLGIPSNLLGTLPYLGTLIFMVMYGLLNDKRSLAAPAALGVAYRRGER